MSLEHVKVAVRHLNDAIDMTPDPAERAQLIISRSGLLSWLLRRGIIMGTESDAIPWCEACGTYHVKPRNRDHHDLLQCRAAWKEKK